VVAKGKGSGMLRDARALDAFLEEIFSKSPLPISVKTRLGLERAEEFPAILDVFNQYPIQELTIHPRVRKQFYAGDVDMDMFRYAVSHSKNPICYNGNLNNMRQIQAISKEFPELPAVMIGRGLIGDPGMLCPSGSDRKALEGFMTELLDTYFEVFGGARNAMFRMKENWGFLRHRFEGSDRLWKELRKTTDISEYRRITAQIFHTLPLTENFDPAW
jgi:tRNA-dihydrouridine synthase